MIAGFQFDGESYKKQIDEFSNILFRHSDLFRGFSEDIEGEYKKLLDELEEQGIEELLSEVNRQLDNWYFMK